MLARAHPYWLLAALALGCTSARAQDVIAEKAPEAAPDEELLEFLGSLDSEDEDFIEYLSETDIAQAGRTAPAPADSEVKKDE